MGDVAIIGNEGKVIVDKIKGTNLMFDIGNGKFFCLSLSSLFSLFLCLYII